MRTLNFQTGRVILGLTKALIEPIQDQGVFHLYINEDPYLTSNFRWEDGTYQGSSTLSLAGQSITTTAEIKFDANGMWQSIAMNTPRGPVEVVRKENQGIITFENNSTTIELQPQTVLFENYSPALLSLTLAQYDYEKSGKQTVSTFVVASKVIDASLELQDRISWSVESRDCEFLRYKLDLAGLDLIVWADENHWIYLVDVPSQHAAFVREGYDLLAKREEQDPLLSKPTYEVLVERGVQIPMRDGIFLATDIYRPKADGKFPAIIVRTPYKKEIAEPQARFYVRHGYVYAIQDVRGRFASSGTWEPFVNEKEDGYDTVEWLAVQPWASGKVGSIGASYLGWVQWWTASQRPPHLVTIIPNVAPPDPFFNIPYEYGVFYLYAATWWAAIVESEATGDVSGVTFEKINEKKYGNLLRSLPVIDLDKVVLGKENPYWRTWIAHPNNDFYWARASFLDELKNVRIPVFHQSGWFDGDGIGSKLNYAHMASHNHPNQKLILGPWEHTDTAHRRVGDRDFGPPAVIDLQQEYLRWFDYWLKGIDNGIISEPLVKIFVMGSNQWLEGNRYPLEYTQFQKWYLSSNGHANTSKGDGKLIRQIPRSAAADKYVYNPGDPTPAPHYYEEPEREKGSIVSKEDLQKTKKVYHEQVTQKRGDILVYVSEPFKESFTFAGPVSAVLYASTTGKDTDWFVRLMEVEKDGAIFLLGEGKLRARFHRSFSKPTLLKPKKVYEYKLDLWQTGITIPAGNRLRVEVTSASFPLFSRNLNTGGHNETETKYVKAIQTIYHNKKHPSHIILPVIPTEKLVV